MTAGLIRAAGAGVFRLGERKGYGSVWIEKTGREEREWGMKSTVCREDQGDLAIPRVLSNGGLGRSEGGKSAAFFRTLLTNRGRRHID